MNLSEDQKAAKKTILDHLKKHREATLAGAAGTGKTTLMRSLLHDLKGRNYLLLAPTGKAAKRLQEVTRVMTTTIHSSLYRGATEDEQNGELDFTQPQPPRGCGRGTLVVVDEASMVNEALANDLRTQVFTVGGKILWVGDQQQLAPVKGKWGARLDEATATLTQVHRQALESPVLQLATAIRNRQPFDGWCDDVQRIRVSNLDPVLKWYDDLAMLQMLSAFGDEDETISRAVLCYTNRTRVELNRRIRELRKFEGDLNKGEEILITQNAHGVGLMNGEVLTVNSLKEDEIFSKVLGSTVYRVNFRGLPNYVLVAAKQLGADRRGTTERAKFRQLWAPLWAPRNPRHPGQETSRQLMRRMNWHRSDLVHYRNVQKHRAVMCDYGYALTTHKSQGSQWDHVAFVSEPAYRNMHDKDNKRRLAYTAVTRAAQTYIAFIL